VLTHPHSEGESLQFTGLPFFAPEMFRSVEVADPLKTKQLRAGLTQLGEEGAIQVFRPVAGTVLLRGRRPVLRGSQRPFSGPPIRPLLIKLPCQWHIGVFLVDLARPRLPSGPALPRRVLRA
jgi:hypothetical protein